MPAFIFAAHDLAQTISLELKHRPCRVLVAEVLVSKIRAPFYSTSFCVVVAAPGKRNDLVFRFRISLPAHAFL